MDLYSRIVAYLKVLLPLAALALLSTLFLLSRSIDPTGTIPFAKHEMEERVRGQQITAPFFSGTTDDGDEITISARLARPAGDGGLAGAEDLRARMNMATGGQIDLAADTGSVAPDQDLASFAGNVRVTTSTGYTIETERLNASLSAVAGDTPGEISAEGPIGTFTAGRMQIGAKNEGGPIHMLFKNGVKLVYDPKKPER